MLDLTKPVQTRDGHPARIIAKDFQSIDQRRPVVACVKINGAERICIYPISGLLDPTDPGGPHPRDLINVPTPTCAEQIKALVLVGHEVRIKLSDFYGAALWQVTLGKEPSVGASFRGFGNTLEEAVALAANNPPL